MARKRGFPLKCGFIENQKFAVIRKLIFQDEGIQNDGYLLIFSVTERNSLTFIQSCLHDILKNDKRFHHQTSFQRKVPLKLRFHRQKPSAGGSPVISDTNSSHDKHQPLEEEDVEPPKPVLYLVGNKQDLVRNRVVSEAG